MSKKSLFFSPNLKIASLAGIGFLGLATTFTVFTTISKNKSFSNYFSSFDLHKKLSEFFPKAQNGINSTFSSVISLWSQVKSNISALNKLVEFVNPVWEKVKSLTSNIAPGFKTIGNYLVQGWSYVKIAWEAVYGFLSTNMKWNYLLIFPGIIYLSIKYFSDISKTLWRYIKSNLRKLWLFKWMFKTLKKWLEKPIKRAKKLWESVKTIVYTFGYKWIKAAVESTKGFKELQKYVKGWAEFKRTTKAIWRFFRVFEAQIKKMDDATIKKIVDLFLSDPKKFIEKIEFLTLNSNKLFINGDKKIEDLLKQDISSLKTQSTIKEVGEVAKEAAKSVVDGLSSILGGLFGGGSSGSKGSKGAEGSEKGGEAGSSGGGEKSEKENDKAGQPEEVAKSLLEKVIDVLVSTASGIADGVSAATQANSPSQEE